ncbi:hypothetical protein [Rhodococcus opacus]|uniref:hypothetical protein n=1 Tax=Rhodococcus opacus TaxID=37919 RepID=UPI00105702C1|nr:hypothetical protein [Rhodococcus opacus]
MTDPDTLLARAATVLRAAPEPGWEAISDRVLAAVRAATQHGRPLIATPAPVDPGPGALLVTDRVLCSTLARVLRRHHPCRPTGIDLDIDEGILRGLTIEITARYGTDLPVLADQIARTAATVVTDLLGDSADPALDTIRVIVTDLVTDGGQAPTPPA